MKKCFFALMMVLMASVIMSGKVDAQVVFGIKAGPDFSSTTSKITGSKNTTNLIVGITGGVYAMIPLLPELNLQPSLLYEGKGGSTQGSEGYRIKTRLNYLTLPVDLLFMPEMPSGAGTWIVGLGPYFGYGISGKKSGGGIDDFDPFKDGFFNRFDAGANVQLGFEMSSGLNISALANVGIVNISSLGKAYHTRNTSFGITLGYTFKK